jgi:DNA repair exonuclease SbcCD ATPase subunit
MIENQVELVKQQHRDEISEITAEFSKERDRLKELYDSTCVISEQRRQEIERLEVDAAKAHEDYRTQVDGICRMQDEVERLKAELAHAKLQIAELAGGMDRQMLISERNAANHLLDSAKALIDAFNRRDDQLREGLRRLEWSKNLGFMLHRDGSITTNVMGCFICDGQKPIEKNQDVAGHKPDCWLAALLEEK